MIIPIIIYISCLGLNAGSTKTRVFHETQLFSLDAVERNSRFNNTFQEKSQVHFLLGVQTFYLEDYILARSFGIQCLDEMSRFSVMQIESVDIPWPEVPIQTKGICDDTPSLLLSIPSDSTSVACMTWTLAAWSQLLQEYQIESAVMNAKSILVMTTWLEEHRQCLDSPWVRFAIATGFLYGADIKENESRQKEREEYALSLIESLWDHPEIGDFVRFWYIRYRVQNTEISKQEVAIWMASLKGGRLENDNPQVKQLRKKLKERQAER